MRPQRPPSISNQIQIMMSNPEGHDCPDCFISFHASVLRLKKKKKTEREDRDQSVLQERKNSPFSPQTWDPQATSQSVF